MLHDLVVRPFRAADTAACLAMFDENCPSAFAPNERNDLADYLRDQGHEYRLYLTSSLLAGGCGFHLASDARSGRLNWIMAARAAHGVGLGRIMMEDTLRIARDHSAVAVLHIAASQHSAPFFQRFGAVPRTTTEHGWGPGMHRVDVELVVKRG